MPRPPSPTARGALALLLFSLWLSGLLAGAVLGGALHLLLPAAALLFPWRALRTG
jgi:hypothetical protein